MNVYCKKLIFKSHHMGTKENDIIFGKFADLYLASFTKDELTAYEKLLTSPDTDLQMWLQGIMPIPAPLDNIIWKRVKDFYEALAEKAL